MSDNGKHLNGVIEEEKCCYPSRNDGTFPYDSTQSSWEITDLCSCILKKAMLLRSSHCPGCQRHPNTSPLTRKDVREDVSILAAICALALWDYAEVGVAKFGLYDTSLPSSTCLQKSCMKLFTASKSRIVATQDLLDLDNWTVCDVSKSNRSCFNTAIVIYRDEEHEVNGKESIVAKTHLCEQILDDGADEEKCDIIIAFLPATCEWFLMYRTGILSSGQAEHLASFLTDTITTLIIQAPGQDNCTLPGLSGPGYTQRAQIDEWNSHELTQPSSPTIHQIIHDISAAQPEHPAIIGPDVDLTYLELDAISSRMAYHLQSFGIKPGTFIPVCFNKSAWAIVAMLAINKTGAAFVPLDPSQPIQRIRSIIEQLNNPPLAIVSHTTNALLDDLLIPTLTISETTVQNLPQTKSPTDWPIDGAAPSYCLFTSGSTGEPKGCVVDHSALASVSTHCPALHLGCASRTLQFASFSFGVSLIEIWCTLTAGGTICMPSDSDRVSRLAEAIESMEINWAFVTPTVLATLDPEAVPGLRHILVAGEALKKAQITTWAERTNLFQAFGFTEWAGVCCVSPRVRSLADVDVIGVPANARCWLVRPDNYDNLAPIGAVAELVVEGPSLAQGYLQKPKETAERFRDLAAWRGQRLIESPRTRGCHRENVRYYRTGDLVHYDSKGLLRYVSRQDLQVKIRGQRIHLGEPESYITRASPQFRKAVIEAVIPVDSDGEAVLVTFIPQVAVDSKVDSKSENTVINGSHGEDQHALFVHPEQEFLSSTRLVIEEMKQNLPDAMIPQIFLQIKAMPLTISRKVDRRKLRAEAGKLTHNELLEWAGTAASANSTITVVAPNGTNESLLHALITKVLRLSPESVGMEHDFFALGGDSVKAMKLVGLARVEGIRLTVKDIFRTSQLRELASTITQSRKGHTPQTQAPTTFSLIDSQTKTSLVSRAATACGVEESQVEDLYPCTPLQEGMMALSSARPGAYIARFVYKLKPHTDPITLGRAWASVVKACPILRTRIISTEDGKLYQAVIRHDESLNSPLDIAHGDWDTYVEKRRKSSFMLGQQLMHASFVQGSIPDDPTETNSIGYFVVTMHHAVCDRWASRQIMALLEQAYSGQNPSPMPMAPFIQYVQQQCTGESVRDYWKSALNDMRGEVFPALPSPGYNPVATDSHHISLVYPGDMPTKHTISNVLRLAWGLVISHYTTSTDVVFGITTSGRAAPVANIDILPAPAVATVPFRLQLNTKKTVMEALSEVQRQSSEMIPFEQFGLQHIRKLSVSAADACSFQSQLVVQPSWGDEDRPIFSIVHADSEVEGGFANCILSVICSLTSTQQIDVTMEFDSKAIQKADVERITSHFAQIIQFLIAQQLQSLADVPHLSPADVEKLLEWNNTVSIHQNPSQCVHETIQQRCVEQPTSTAVWAWDGKLTYSELDRLSSGVAAKLTIEHAVVPEVIVPICMEKSCWTTVAMLGVMKAGGAFVLLDPSQPQQRLEGICSRIDAHLILTSSEKLSFAQTMVPLSVVIDREFCDSGLSTAYEPIAHPVPQTSLYVAFTSGSTGTPKGVVIEHEAFCCSALGLNHATLLTRDSRLLQFASYSFDGSIMETLSALMAGACVCVPSDFQRQNELAAATKMYDLTHAHLTPSLARHILRSKPTFTKTLVSVGEPLTSSDLADWAGNNQNCRVMNGYGPAECAVSTTIQPHITSQSNPHNIGFPLRGVSCWVVHPDDSDILLPIGAVGELLVEGPTVARGYLKDLEQSADMFIASPPPWLRRIRPDGPYARMYKTGDLVRYAPDGSLQYVGRRDAQVKLRGQRIELEEVQSQILMCWPELKDAAVEMVNFKDTSMSTQCLVAFVVPEPQQIASKGGINGTDVGLVTNPSSEFGAQKTASLARLRDAIPTYMIPEVFLPVHSLPNSASGKLDRRSLQALAKGCSPEQLASYRSDLSKTRKVAPTSDQGHVMQAIWAHVLNRPLEYIGVEDNFYHLGGDSITAMQIVAQARSKGLAVSLDQIMRHKTISQILLHAKSVAAAGKDHSDDEYGVWFSLSPVQQMFLDHQMPGADLNRFSQTFLLQIRRPTELDKLHAAVQILFTRHSMLRAVFSREQDGGRWAQMIRDEQQSRYRCIAHRVDSRTDMKNILSSGIDAIDIEKGPVLSLDLIDVTSDNSQHLFLAIHHLVVDLVSWRTLLSELESILGENALSQRPDSISFKKWCDLQKHHAEANLTPKVALPFDLPDTYHEDPSHFWYTSAELANTMGNTQTQKLVLDERTTRDLLGVANVTLNTRPADILHAALLHSFNMTFPDRTSPLIFTEGHGRESWDSSIDIGQTVGWFTTVWPVVVEAPDVHQHDGLLEMIQRVQHAYRAVPSKGWQYFASRYLNPDGRRRFQHLHPMEVIFNYAGEFQQLENTDSLFVAESHESQGALVAGDKIQRFGIFEVFASVLRGQLQLQFVYPRNINYQNAIVEWVHTCKTTLEAVVPRLMTADKPHQDIQFTVADFPLLSNLKYTQLQELSETTLPAAKIPLDNVEDIYACSPSQRGMLIAQAKQPHNYNASATWKITSRMGSGAKPDIQQLYASCAQVIERHAALRTVFVDSPKAESFMEQVVLKQVPLDSVIIQTTACISEPLPVAQSDTWPKGELMYRINLCSLKDDPEGAVLLRLDMSHTIMDRTTMRVIERDIGLAYEGNLTNGRGPLFSDYVSYIYQQDDEAATQYWKKYLEGVEPCEFPRLKLTNISASDEEEEWGYVSRELLESSLGGKTISDFCRRYDVTLWNLAALAWALVLRSYTNSESVCFGYIKSGRDLPVDGIQDAVGAILNPLVCRVSFSREASVQQTIHSLQEEYLKAIQHQTFSLSDAHRLAGVGNGVLFNTSVGVEAGQAEFENNSILDFNTVQMADGAEDDLVVSISHRLDKAVLNLRYKTNVLSSLQACSVIATFEKAICSIVTASQDTSVTAVDMLSRHDESLIWERNRALPDAVPFCVHEVIQKHCDEQPHAEAVCDTNGSFTYRELERLSSRLACYLIAEYGGLAPNEVVPVCMDKSRWTPVAMLAILKAGGAILLIEPSYPYQRKRSICDEVKARIILACPKHGAVSREFADTVVLVGTDHTSWNRTFERNIHLPKVQPNQALYIVFTSGSTGKPKGLIIEHGSYCTGAKYHTVAANMTRQTRTTQWASYAFDLSVIEQLSTLMVGGCVCVITDEQRKNNFGEVASALKANFASLVPSVARLFMPQDLSTIRSLMLVGEPMSETDISSWAPDMRLINGYGPAECSGLAVVNPSVSAATDPRNVGYPVGCTLWLVDPFDHHRLVPYGAVGELVIEGPIVGRGYINSPDKTRQAFISAPDWLCPPNSDCPRPARLYKTGDLGRLNDDGSLIVIGRKDRQVKVRGQRLELAEVEVHVQRSFQDSAHDVVVEMITPSDSRKSQLAALLVLRDVPHEEDGNGEPVRTQPHDIIGPPTKTFASLIAAAEIHLRQAVPSYMIPAIFLPILQMPRTPSGKVDRGRLRQIAGSMPLDAMLQYRAAASIVASGKVAGKLPSTAAERTLAEIWSQVLDVPRDTIFADDSFFLRGGHSIDAMKAAALARRAGMHLGVSDMFAHPTLSGMAALATSSGDGTTTAVDDDELYKPLSLASNETPHELHARLSAAGVIPAGSTLKDLLPATQVQDFFIQRGTFHSYNFTIKGDSIDMARLRGVCQALTDRYSILRTSFLELEGVPFQLVLENIDAQLREFICAPDQDPLDFCKVMWSNIDLPELNVMGGSLPVRFTLISHPNGRYTVLTIQISHAQWDGISISRLFSDLAALYNEKALQPTRDFTDYAYRCLSSSTQPKSRDISFDFWREYLKGVVMDVPFPPLEKLLCQDPILSAQGYQTLWTFKGIPTPSIPAGVTLATLVKAASAFYLSHHLARHDIVFGHTVNGRNLPLDHIESLLGCCLNFVPLRITFPDSEGDWTVQDLLSHTQSQYTRALPHEHLELRDIIKNSTGWPAGQPLSFIVQHQNIDLTHSLPLRAYKRMGEEAAEDTFLDVTYSRLACFDPKDEVWVFTEPHPDRLEVQVAANSRVLSQQRATNLADQLAMLIERFAENPRTKLADISVSCI